MCMFLNYMLHAAITQQPSAAVLSQHLIHNAFLLMPAEHGALNQHKVKWNWLDMLIINKKVLLLWNALIRNQLTFGGERAAQRYAVKDTGAEERLGYGGHESNLSGTEGADTVHNDAIWSSHGAMHTLH